MSMMADVCMMNVTLMLTVTLMSFNGMQLLYLYLKHFEISSVNCKAVIILFRIKKSREI